MALILVTKSSKPGVFASSGVSKARSNQPNLSFGFASGANNSGSSEGIKYFYKNYYTYK